MTRRQNRFQEKPIDRFIGVVQRGQVDLPVPARKQFVIRHELSGENVGEKQSYLRCPSDKTGAEISGGHLIRVSEGTQIF